MPARLYVLVSQELIQPAVTLLGSNGVWLSMMNLNCSEYGMIHLQHALLVCTRGDKGSECR